MYFTPVMAMQHFKQPLLLLVFRITCWFIHRS